MPKVEWVDPKRLQEELRNMGPRSWLYKLLKEELTKQGRWKNLGRGKTLWK